MATKRRVVVMKKEAVRAANRKGPSIARLTQIMNSHHLRHEAKSWEQRWLAARWLEAMGIELERSDK